VSAAPIGVQRRLRCINRVVSAWVGGVSASATRIDAPNLVTQYSQIVVKPFVEDELPALPAGKQALVAQPGSAQPCPAHLQGPAAFGVGPPKGGFTDYEVDKIAQGKGGQAVHLGQRIKPAGRKLRYGAGSRLF